MTTTEVASYLRLKERKIYELVRLRRIPCSHVTGKLLFPRQMIDLWVARQTEFDGPELRPPPRVAAGSHDLPPRMGAAPIRVRSGATRGR